MSYPSTYITVDIGATSVKVFHKQGRRSASLIMPNSNSNAAPKATTSMIIRILNERAEHLLLERWEDFSHVSLIISNAGYTKRTEELYRALTSIEELNYELVDQKIVELIHGNDSIVPLLAGGDAVLISGTGSNLVFREQLTGRLVRAGGAEWVADDKGSGTAIAMAALRKVNDNLIFGISSPLTSSMKEFYSVKGDDELFKVLVSLAEPIATMKPRIASVAKLVTDLAEAGDEESLEIFEGEIRRLSRHLERCLELYSIPGDVRILTIGSLATNELFQSLLKRGVSDLYELSFVPVQLRDLCSVFEDSNVDNLFWYSDCSAAMIVERSKGMSDDG